MERRIEATIGVIATGLTALSGWSCGVLGPSCLEQREGGPVTTIGGEVAAGGIESHRVAYETRGSQNEARISWEGQSDLSGPRLQLFATRVDCVEFKAPPVDTTGACTVLASAGWIGGHLANSLNVVNGRGNPDVLGHPAEYKLWVIGDPHRSARYTIAVTWFYGPDC